MKSVMVDIETLGTGPDAAVISIGVAAFNADEGVIATDGWAIGAKHWHGYIDPTTVKWWNDQHEAARNFSFKGEHTDLSAAHALSAFAAQYGGDECWANDPDFDIVILRKWWDRVAAANKLSLGKFPFHYREMRSQRTIMAEGRRLGIAYEHVYNTMGVAHNPIDDAAVQARVVNYIRTQITNAEALRV